MVIKRRDRSETCLYSYGKINYMIGDMYRFTSFPAFRHPFPAEALQENPPSLQ